MKKAIVPVRQITQAIHFLQGQRVLLDSDLAALYEVTTGALNQAVRRNRARFPAERGVVMRRTVREVLLRRPDGSRP